MGKPRTYEEITKTIHESKERRPDQAAYWDDQQAKLDRQKAAEQSRLGRVLKAWRVGRL